MRQPETQVAGQPTQAGGGRRRRTRATASRIGLFVALALLPGAVFANPAAAITGRPIVQNGTPATVTGGVELKGRVDPYGFDTHYRFEYGPTTSYGTSVPVPDADIGSANEFINVQQTISGLQPNTTYHFRIVAVNEAGPPVESPDATFSSSESTPPPTHEEPPYGGGGGAPTPGKGGKVRLKIERVKGKRVLAAANGRTLYSLSAEKNGKFICTKGSGCLAVWKPVMIPSGGSVVGPVKLGSVKRPEGGRQATYRGLPLYAFVEDTKPGEANGEGIKDVGTWHAVKLPKPKH
jgi:predicted lipoprotein with Yx(FWY)xxD motif